MRRTRYPVESPRTLLQSTSTREVPAETPARRQIARARAQRLGAPNENAEDLVLGYLSVAFSVADRPTVDVYLSVLLTHTQDGWQISHYQASRL